MIKATQNSLNNQSGSVLIIALMMMIVLTLIGIASTTTSTLENSVSGNKRASTDAFFVADAGIEAALANSANFPNDPTTLPGYIQVQNTLGLSPALKSQKIGGTIKGKFPAALNLSAGANFTDPPTVMVYRPSRVGGYGVSNLQARANPYIIDSTGRDQGAGLALVRSQCEIMEAMVKSNAGNEMEN